MPQPPFYKLVDILYHTVMDGMPQWAQDRDMASAFVLGSLGSYSVIKGLQWTSRNVMDRVIPNFDEKWLPILEGICIAVPVLYALADPDGAREIMTQHPTYTSGMGGVYIGGLVAAVQDLHNFSIRKYQK